MNVRQNPCALTRILQEDARRVCTQEKMDQIWLAIEVVLFPPCQTNVNTVQLPRQIPWCRRILASLLCAIAIACYGAGILSLLPARKQPLSSGYAIIRETVVPLAVKGNAIRVSLSAVFFGLGTVAMVAGIWFGFKPQWQNHFGNRRNQIKKIDNNRPPGEGRSTIRTEGRRIKEIKTTS